MGVDGARVGRYLRAARRWANLLLPRTRRPAGLRVFYGHDLVPAPGEPVAGGTAKSQRLAERFPNSPSDFTLLYLGSTWLPRDLDPLLGVEINPVDRVDAWPVTWRCVGGLQAG